MEFKGTKGKWFIDQDEWVLTDDKTELGDIICAPPEEWELSNIKWQANAKLISKAPEMLEKLCEIVQAIENETIIIQENEDNDGWENFGGRFYSEAKKLIKEATELS